MCSSDLVDRLNLDVLAGEIFGLLGPNGAGKTTTAGMLTTRVVPTSGRAFLGGVDVAAHPALVKQLSGIVSQQNTLDRQLTVWENLIILPITFLGGTYYSWTKLAPVTLGGWHWLQTLVLINPLIYVNEGMRAAFTLAPHMQLYVVYPVVFAFGAVFLAIGLRNFRRRVLS